MKNAVQVALAVLLLFSFAACNSPSITQERSLNDQNDTQESALVEQIDDIDEPSDYQFAIVYGGAHPFFSPWKPGAKAAARDLGIPEPYILSPQAWDQTEQNQVLESVIAKGVKGIGMFPSDAYAGNEQITKIAGRGIPVVTMGGAPAEPSKAVFCYATDVGASVSLGVQELINKLKQNGLTQGNIVHL